MKKYLVFLIVVFSLISCQEDISFNNPSLQGMKDNIFWRAVSSKAFLDFDGSLIIEGYTGNEVLTLRTTFTKVQKYLLGNVSTETAVYVLTNDNVEISFTTGNGIGNGEIVITEYDNVVNTVSGTFKLKAEKIDGDPSEGDIFNFNKVFFVRH